jgi:hypothetical protein
LATTTADAAVNDSPAWSLTNRTARALNSGSILFAMAGILPTHKDAASNLGRFNQRALDQLTQQTRLAA